MENWKAVAGFEGRYEVSDFGTVRRLEGLAKNGQGYKRLEARIIPPTLSQGYHVINLWKENSYKRVLVHRLVLSSFVGDSDLSVDHINGDKIDNRLQNLEYCTLIENTKRQHRDGRGVAVKGTLNGKAKLNPELVRRIRSLLSSGLSRSKVAEIIGVSDGTVQAVHTKRTWAHVL